jgi:hypothetical protein
MEAAHHISQELLIPDFRMPEFQRTLDSLNRKLAKLGLSELQYTTRDVPLMKLHKGSVSEVVGGGDQSKIYTIEHPVFIDIEDPTEALDRPYYFKASRLQLEGDLPVLGGWSFMGVKSLEHSLPVFRMYAGEPPEAFKTSGALCEHCNTQRTRKELYLLQEAATGKWMEVGKSCLSDFTGVDSAERKLLRLQEVYALFSANYMDPDELGSAMGAASPMEELSTFLSYVAFSAEQFGYVTSKQAKADDSMSTALHAQRIMYDRHESYQKMRREIAEDWERYKGIARDAISHWQTADHQDSTFEANLSIIAQDGYFHAQKEAGLAAYLVGAYLRSKDKEALQSQLRNEYLPGVEEGERLSGKKLYTNFIKPIDSFYGMSYLHRFHDDDGYTYTWFGTRRIDKPDGFRAAFTIKGFEDYQGTKQTQITRVDDLDAKAQKALDDVRQEIMVAGEESAFTIPDDGCIILGRCENGIEITVDDQLQRVNLRDPEDTENEGWSFGALLDAPLLKAVRKFAKDADIALPRRKPIRGTLQASISADVLGVKKFTANDGTRDVKNFTPSVHTLRQQLKRDLSPELIRQLETSGKLVLLARESDLDHNDDAAMQASIRAWHGSPNHFDEFRLEFVKSGQGETAFGHGLYFSGNERIAAGYRASLSKRHETLDGNRIVHITRTAVWVDQGGDIVQADLSPEQLALIYDVGLLGNSVRAAINGDFEFRQTQLKRTDPDNIEERDRIESRIEAATDLLSRLHSTDKGALYECELMIDAESMLNWHLPLSAQPDPVKDGIASLAHAHPDLLDSVIRDALTPDGELIATRLTGEDVYRSLVDSAPSCRRYARLCREGRVVSPEHFVSVLLRQTGIEGVRYPVNWMSHADDYTPSQDANADAFNYVVFDETRICIRHVHSTANNALQGGYDRTTGRMYLIAENLSPSTASAVLLHEALHMSATDTHIKEWKRLRNRLEVLYDQADVLAHDCSHSALTPSLAVDAYHRVAHAQAHDKRLSRTDQIEEFGAYLVELEQTHRAEISVFRQWARDAKGAIQHLCLSALGVQLGTPSPSQLRHMAKCALRSCTGKAHKPRTIHMDEYQMDLPINRQNLSRLSLPQITSLAMQYRESPLASEEINGIVDHVLRNFDCTELMAFYGMTQIGRDAIVQRIGAQGSLFQVAWLYHEIKDSTAKDRLYSAALLRFDADSLDGMMEQQRGGATSCEPREADEGREVDLDTPIGGMAFAASRCMSQ